MHVAEAREELLRYLSKRWDYEEGRRPDPPSLDEDGEAALVVAVLALLPRMGPVGQSLGDGQ